MRVEWKVESESARICWQEMQLAPLKLKQKDGVKRILDVGGGNGSFTGLLLRENIEIVTIDVSLDSFKGAVKGISPVLGDVLHMPFKDGGFQGAAGRAILHHIPDKIDEVLKEIKRILDKGSYIVIEEPCSNNLLANVARKFFVTERHDPKEKPLDPKLLSSELWKQFTVLEEKPFFVLSYLMPHLASRFPSRIRKIMVGLTRALFKLDTFLIENFESMRNRAAYICIVARKSE